MVSEMRFNPVAAIVCTIAITTVAVASTLQAGVAIGLETVGPDVLETQASVIDGGLLYQSLKHVAHSPDQRSWAVKRVGGDVQSDQKWVQLIFRSTSSLKDATPNVFSRKLVTDSQRHSDSTNCPVLIDDSNPIFWLSDGNHVELHWCDAETRHHRYQIFTVERRTGVTKQLTKHPTSVLKVAPSDRVEFIHTAVARALELSERVADRGFVVTHRYVYGLLAGTLDGEQAETIERKV